MDTEGVVENMEACRGEHSCRGCTSWVHLACRGTHRLMSWNTGMSWEYVVDNSRLLGDGCRGDRGTMSWRTCVLRGMSWGLRSYVVGNKYVVEACRGEQSFPGGMSWGRR